MPTERVTMCEYCGTALVGVRTKRADGSVDSLCGPCDDLVYGADNATPLPGAATKDPDGTNREEA